jgi:diguanylate cyclase (GGDEF)-like protein
MSILTGTMQGDRSHRHARSRALDGYVGALALASACLVVVAAFHAKLDRPAYVAAVVAATVAATFLPVLPAGRGRAVHSFTVVEVAVVLAVATLPAADALVAAGIAAAIEIPLWPGCRHKALYNTSELVVGMALAVAIADPGAPRTLTRVALLALAGLSYSLVTALLTHVVLVIAQGAGWVDLRAAAKPALTSAATSVPLGLLAAAVSDSWVLLVLCLGPVGVLLLFAATAERAQVEHERAAALAAVAHAAAAATTRAEIVELLLDGAQRVTGTQVRLGDAAGPPDTVSVPLGAAFAPDTWLVTDRPGQHAVINPDAAPTLRTLAAVATTSLDNLRLRERLHELATTDELTGLGNRREFAAHLEEAGRRAARGRPFGVLFVDLDRFKSINDRHGHATGDAVLRAVAQRLLDAVRANDRVFRLAGDEFTVVADGVTTEHDLALLAAKLRAHVCGPVDHEGVPVEVGASIGGALCTGDTESVWAVLSAADERMYAAKSRAVPAQRA